MCSGTGMYEMGRKLMWFTWEKNSRARIGKGPKGNATQCAKIQSLSALYASNLTYYWILK